MFRWWNCVVRVPLGAVAGVPAIELIRCDRQYDPDPVFCCSSAKSCWTGLLLARPAFRLATKVREAAQGPVRSPDMNGWVCSFVAIPLPGMVMVCGLIATLLKMPAPGADFDSVRRNCCRLHYAARFSGRNWRCTFLFLTDENHSTCGSKEKCPFQNSLANRCDLRYNNYVMPV